MRATAVVVVVAAAVLVALHPHPLAVPLTLLYAALTAWLALRGLSSAYGGRSSVVGLALHLASIYVLASYALPEAIRSAELVFGSTLALEALRRLLHVTGFYFAVGLGATLLLYAQQLAARAPPPEKTARAWTMGALLFATGLAGVAAPLVLLVARGLLTPLEAVGESVVLASQLVAMGVLAAAYGCIPRGGGALRRAARRLVAAVLVSVGLSLLALASKLYLGLLYPSLVPLVRGPVVAVSIGVLLWCGDDVRAIASLLTSIAVE